MEAKVGPSRRVKILVWMISGCTAEILAVPPSSTVAVEGISDVRVDVRAMY